MNTMNKTKLSQHTLSVLKNFSSLNSNLLVKQGNVINTITPAKNVVAQAVVDETFDVEFGIWDLNKFLGTVSLFDDPEFTFNEKSMEISGNGSNVNYYYSEPRLLTVLDREIKMPETAVSFTLKESTFNELQRAAAVLQLQNLSIRSTDDGNIELVILDKKSPTTNTFSKIVGENVSGASFDFNLHVDNLKMLPGDYDIEICRSVVSKFSDKSCDLVYYIALEPDSTYED